MIIRNTLDIFSKENSQYVKVYFLRDGIQDNC